MIANCLLGVDMRLRKLSVMTFCPAALIAGCSNADEAVSVEGLPYDFPRNHVSAVVSPQEGMRFVRLRPPDEEFLLVSDARADRRQRNVGHIIISKINFDASDRADKLERHGETIYCSGSLKYNCGFQLDDNGHKWSVIFSRVNLDDVPDFKRRAEDLVAGYRTKTSED